MILGSFSNSNNVSRNFKIHIQLAFLSFAQLDEKKNANLIK